MTQQHDTGITVRNQAVVCILKLSHLAGEEKGLCCVYLLVFFLVFDFADLDYNWLQLIKGVHYDQLALKGQTALEDCREGQ